MPFLISARNSDNSHSSCFSFIQLALILTHLCIIVDEGVWYHELTECAQCKFESSGNSVVE